MRKKNNPLHQLKYYDFELFKRRRQKKNTYKDYVNNYLRESLNDLEICVIHHEFKKSADFYSSILSSVSLFLSTSRSLSFFHSLFTIKTVDISFALLNRMHAIHACVCVSS